MTHDATVAAPRSRTASGLAFALVSAVTFGLSGALARPLLESGWSAGAVDLVRVGGAALLVAPFAAVALRGQWDDAAPQRRPGRDVRRPGRRRAPSSATSRPSRTCRSDLPS